MKIQKKFLGDLKDRKFFPQQNPRQHPDERRVGTHDGGGGTGRDHPETLGIRVVDQCEEEHEQQGFEQRVPVECLMILIKFFIFREFFFIIIE